MKILVTGGAGFIGSAFIRHWFKTHPEDEIINLDALTYAGNLENLREVEGLPNYKFVHGNILDASLDYKLMAGVDTVVHFAAESHVTRSENDPMKFHFTNVLGTGSLLHAALLHLWEGQQVRFVHISTDEVYGPIKDGFFKEEYFRPDLATSDYAWSKSRADMLVRSCRDLGPIIVRPTNNFGQNQYPEKVLPRWITSAMEGQPLKLWAPGNQVRDWLYVGDTCRALDLIIHQAEPGSVFNIGANLRPEVTNLEMAQRVVAGLGLSESLIKVIPNPRPEHDERYGVDTTLIKELGWQPGDFNSQLEATIDWYVNNEPWWKPLKLEAEALYQDKEKS
jgi:dTDP-glucose 4,6-dehydratase